MINNHNSFTLIEIFVVILIITLLAALLFPILVKSRRHGVKIACTNNLRQVFTCNSLYATDYKFYAPGRLTSASVTGQHWHGYRDSDTEPWDETQSLIFTYAGKNRAINECPAITLIKEHIHIDEYPNMGYMGFGYNFAGVGSKAYLQDEKRSINIWESGMQPENIQSPSKTVMFGDCAMLFNKEIVISDCLNPPFSVQNASPEKLKTKKPTNITNDSRVHFRHLGQANIVWVDGHVSGENLSFSWDTGRGPIDNEFKVKLNIGAFGPKDNSLYDPWSDDIPEE